jgi:hypothetical protein
MRSLRIVSSHGSNGHPAHHTNPVPDVNSESDAIQSANAYPIANADPIANARPDGYSYGRAQCLLAFELAFGPGFGH